jgi:hypothetical protein
MIYDRQVALKTIMKQLVVASAARVHTGGSPLLLFIAFTPGNTPPFTPVWDNGVFAIVISHTITIKFLLLELPFSAY